MINGINVFSEAEFLFTGGGRDILPFLWVVGNRIKSLKFIFRLCNHGGERGVFADNDNFAP